MGVGTLGDAVASLSSVGRKKAQLPLDSLLLLGFLAGAYISFGGFLSITAAAGAPWPAGLVGLQRLVFGAVFPVGLVLVVLAGGELFTGNCVFETLAYLDGAADARGVVRNWVWSYVGNFLGSIAVAYFLANLGGLLVREPWAGYLTGIAHSKCALGFWQAFWRGVGCNWLVCLAVWMAAKSENAADKIAAIYLPVMAFVTLGFEHSVANMFIVPAALFISGAGPGLTWTRFLLGNLIPVTLGNIVGGCLLVGCLYWHVCRREQAAPGASRGLLTRGGKADHVEE